MPATADEDVTTRARHSTDHLVPDCTVTPFSAQTTHFTADLQQSSALSIRTLVQYQYQYHCRYPGAHRYRYLAGKTDNMLFAALASVALAISPLTGASPVESRQASHPERFYLQTQVYPGINDCGTNKNGLYVFSYHTGAGLGVAAADPPSEEESWFYLNDTDTGIYWTYTNNTVGP